MTRFRRNARFRDIVRVVERHRAGNGPIRRISSQLVPAPVGERLDSVRATPQRVRP